MKLHEPVMLNEVLNFLVPAHINNPTSLKIIDCTLGTGGHTLALAKAGARVLALDADEEAIAIAKDRFEKEGVKDKVILVNENFIKLPEVAKEKGFEEVEGVLFDLGVNTMQLTSEKRGFWFVNPRARLDMRLKKIGPTAADLLNVLRKDQLVTLFSRVLKKDQATILTKRVLTQRDKKPFKRIGEFLRLCKGIGEKKSLSQGTLPLLALRIAVNSEYENIQDALPQAFEILKGGGKLAVITFHSGEDKLVGDYFKKLEEAGKAKAEKPTFPSSLEIRKNASARSAILRTLTNINGKQKQKE